MMSPKPMKKGHEADGGRPRKRVRMAFLGAMLPVLSGCVEVTAPDRPIEINLNINIRQEVVVRLQDDVRQLIQANPGVF